MYCDILVIVGESMKKTVIRCFLIVYIIFVLIVTFLLMKYNTFSVIEIKNILIFTSNKTEIKDYKKGDLILLKKSDNKKYKVDDNVFYYTVYNREIKVNKGKVTDVEELSEKEKTLTINDKKISSEYVIGKSSKVISLLGYFILLFTSKIGYLLFIVLPMFIFFFVDVRSIFKEVKNKKVKNEKTKNA